MTWWQSDNVLVRSAWANKTWACRFVWFRSHTGPKFIRKSSLLYPLNITPLLNVRLGINDRLMSHNKSKWRLHTHTKKKWLKIKRGHHAAFTYTQLDFENSIKSVCSSSHMGPFQQQAADPFFLLAHSLWQIWSGVLHNVSVCRQLREMIALYI